MIRTDALNLDNYPVRTKMTATKQILKSHVCSMEERKFKEFPVNENLSQSCSTEENK